MIVFFTQKSEALARNVAQNAGAALGALETKVFPDGEVYIRLITKVLSQDVVLIHTTQSNDDLIELFLLLSAMREHGADSITCVVPHLMYQRQDEEFLAGEAISAKVVLNLIQRFADRLITVNAHFMDKGGTGKFGGVKVTNLDAFPLLGRYFDGSKDLVVVAPDEGARQYAEAAGKAIGRPYDYLIKKRLDGENVEMQPKKLNVSGKHVVVLDDIISTGGTMKKAAEMLKSQGARQVSLGCVHGIFTKGTDIFGDLEVVCTDSLPTKFSKVTIAPIIIDALRG